MTLWMLAALAFCGFIALCASLAERLVAACGMARRFVWILVVVLALVVPTIGGFGTRWGGPHATTSVTARGIELRSAPVVSTHDIRVVVNAPTRSRLQRFGEMTSRADTIAAICWILASVLLLTRLFVSLRALPRWEREWTKARVDGYDVWLSDDAGPAVVGFARPSIVIPRWLLEEDTPMRALLLRHEVEHRRAGDTRVWVAAALIDALVPWNFAVRWMLCRLRLAIEIDCDQRVIGSIGAIGRYGMALVCVGERHARPLPVAAHFLDSPIALEIRIRAMSKRSQRRPILGVSVGAAMALVATAVGAWAPWPVARHVRAPESRRLDRGSIVSAPSMLGTVAYTSTSEKTMANPCRLRRSPSALVALPLAAAAACFAPKNQPVATPARVEPTTPSAAAGPARPNDSLPTTITTNPSKTASYGGLKPALDSIIRKTLVDSYTEYTAVVAAAVYEHAQATQRRSGATVWILSDSSGRIIGGTVNAATPSEPMTVHQLAQLFPQAPLSRGMDFVLIRRGLLLHTDTVTAVWAQTVSGQK
ncbi:MAG: M56 family metallopeptidase [bacterium]